MCSICVTQETRLYEQVPGGGFRAPVRTTDATDPVLVDLLGEEAHATLIGDTSLIKGAGTQFDRAEYLAGRQTPVLFGSALDNFGLETLLEALEHLAPPPRPRETDAGMVSPVAPGFSGFVFKIQANMNRKHRDRVAFVRVCSGVFEKDMALTNARDGDTVRATRPYKFFGGGRETVERAYPGDVIGLPNPGKFAIGDTLYNGTPVRYPRVPRFPAEHFGRARLLDQRSKQFENGVTQLEEEGLMQVVFPVHGRREPILGVVGPLQLDIVEARLKQEYSVECKIDQISYTRLALGEVRSADAVRPRESILRHPARGRSRRAARVALRVAVAPELPAAAESRPRTAHRRLAVPTPRPSRPSKWAEVTGMRGRLWLAGVTVVVVAGVVLSARAAVMPARSMAAADQGGAAGQAAGTWTAKTQPEWKGDGGGPRLQLSLRTGDERDHWGFGVPLTELSDLPGAAREGVVADARFTLTREAGTFRLSGSFDRGRGAGTFVFLPSAAYVTAMIPFGYRNLSTGQLMRLAVLDVTTAFTRDLRDAGQTNLPVEDLTRMKIHGATGAVVRGFQGAGLGPLASDDVVRLRIHGVSAEYIAGFKARRYTGLTADDYTRMRIHGVTPDDIDALGAAGLGGLSADDLVRFRIHNVRPEFIGEMRALGFASADEDDFVRMRIHKVDAAFVRESRAGGLPVTTVDDAVDLAIHGRRWRRR